MAQQNIPGFQPGVPPQSGPSAPFQQQGMGSPPPAAGGSDPQAAAARQQLANPNAGDAFAPQTPAIGMADAMSKGFPGPQEMAIGAVAGVGAAQGLKWAFNPAETPRIYRLAQGVDNAPGIKQISQWLGNRLNGIENKHPRIGALLTRVTPEAYEKQVLADVLKNAEKRLGKLGIPQEKLAAMMEKGSVAQALEEIGKLEGVDPKKMKGVLAHLKGLQSSVLEPYKKTHDILSKSGTGPVGRAMLSFSEQMKNIFGAHVPGMAKGNMMKFLGPVFIGAMTIGQSLKEAKDAPQGEKVRSFTHNFMGSGLGMFMGMMAGNKILGSSGVVGKALKGLATKGFLGKFSWGGTALTMLSWFALSIPFQKAGEKLSDLIFGKPSKKQGEPAAQNPQQGGAPGLGAQVAPAAPAQAQAGYHAPANPQLYGTGQPLNTSGMESRREVALTPPAAAIPQQAAASPTEASPVPGSDLTVPLSEITG